MTRFYNYCLRLFRKLFGSKRGDEELNEIWDVSSDTMRIGSDLTDITDNSVWSRESDIAMT